MTKGNTYLDRDGTHGSHVSQNVICRLLDLLTFWIFLALLAQLKTSTCHHMHRKLGIKLAFEPQDMKTIVSYCIGPGKFSLHLSQIVLSTFLTEAYNYTDENLFYM